MANTITKHTLVDGQRNLVVNVHVIGDGSGDETDTQLLDISAFVNAPALVKLKKATWALNAFEITLAWDGSTDIDFLSMSGEGYIDFTKAGGMNNNASTPTGDIMINTLGLGASENGWFVLELQKS